jgi:hypothetical protein
VPPISRPPRAAAAPTLPYAGTWPYASVMYLPGCKPWLTPYGEPENDHLTALAARPATQRLLTEAAAARTPLPNLRSALRGTL